MQAGLPPVHPIDHGYSWLVCLGAFGINLFVIGGMRCTGILFIEVVEVFQADRGLSALTMGLLAAGYAAFSAIGNAVGAMTSMRRASLIGAVLTFLGMLFTCIAPNLMVVILSLGLLSGIGYGFMLGPSLVSVGQYFNQRRSLATGLACTGGSVGTLVIPLLLNTMLTKYGFRGAVLLYAGIILHAIPSAMLLRPAAFYNIKRSGRQQTQPVAEKTDKEAEANNNADLRPAAPSSQQRAPDARIDGRAKWSYPAFARNPSIVDDCIILHCLG